MFFLHYLCYKHINFATSADNLPQLICYFIIQVYVKEVDKYSQHSLEFYRGHVQFWLAQRPDFPTSDTRNTPVASTEDKDLTAEESPSDTEFMVTEFPVILPKVCNN